MYEFLIKVNLSDDTINAEYINIDALRTHTNSDKEVFFGFDVYILDDDVPTHVNSEIKIKYGMFVGILPLMDIVNNNTLKAMLVKRYGEYLI